jgi:hypothetical protein
MDQTTLQSHAMQRVTSKFYLSWKKYQSHVKLFGIIIKFDLTSQT